MTLLRSLCHRAAVLTLASWAALSACSSPSNRPTPQARLAQGDQDLPRAHELGEGVARDYAAAAAQYERRCKQGRGDLVACHRLIDAIHEARGVTRDPARALTLLQHLCEARLDGLACLLRIGAGEHLPGEEKIGAEAGDHDEAEGEDEGRDGDHDAAARRPKHPTTAAVEAWLDTPCDERHLRRCENPRTVFGLGASASEQYDDAEHDSRGCRLGVVQACMRLRYHEGEAHHAAVAMLGRACDRGDSDACDAVDRPIDHATLCKANDYAACATLGCAGDLRAAELAAAHAAPLDCARAALAPVHTGITPSARPPFSAPELRLLPGPDRGGDVKEVATLRYQVSNHGTKWLRRLSGAVYEYDAAGAQLARYPFTSDQRLAPGQGTTLPVPRLGGDASFTDDQSFARLSFNGHRTNTFEVCLDQVHVEEAPPQLARCPQRKAKGARWGDGAATQVLDVHFDEFPLADSYRNALDPALTDAFEAQHPGLLVRGDQAAPAVVVPALGADLAAIRAQRGPMLELPWLRQPTVIAHHVAGVGVLRLSAATLAGILSGQITRWDDAAIARDNPVLRLPTIPIRVLLSASQGDVRLVTRYLSAAAPEVWTQGEISTLAVPGMLTGGDLSRELSTTDGALGLVHAGLAERAGVGLARLQNARGEYVAPTAAAISSGDYPLWSTRMLLVRLQPPDATTDEAARRYATWLLTEAQPRLERLGFARDPGTAAAAAALTAPAAAAAAAR